MTRIIASLLATATFVVAPLASSAAPITVPADLNPGEKYRLAFVTSSTRNAMSLDIADYNAFVSGVANSVTELVALDTTWKVIGSISTVAARDNTGTNPSSVGVPIYGLDGTRIANNNRDFWDGSILNALRVAENGADLGPSLTVVWTGTDPSGLPAPSIPLGASGSLVGVGLAQSEANDWIAFGTDNWGGSHPYYAMSGELTVVPEPNPVVMACVAVPVAGLVSCRRKRWRADGRRADRPARATA